MRYLSLITVFVTLGYLASGCGQGPVGQPGSIGPAGVPGAKGSDGASAPSSSNTTYMIQLCHGDYYVMCVNGQVYSQATLILKAGQSYNIGTPVGSCPITISANCGVAQ